MGGEPVQSSGIQVQGLEIGNYLNNRVGRRASVRGSFPAARGAQGRLGRTPPPPLPPGSKFGLRFRDRAWALRVRVRVRVRRVVACGSGFGDHIRTPAFAHPHPRSALPPPSPSRSQVGATVMVPVMVAPISPREGERAVGRPSRTPPCVDHPRIRSGAASGW